MKKIIILIVIVVLVVIGYYLKNSFSSFNSPLGTNTPDINSANPYASYKNPFDNAY